MTAPNAADLAAEQALLGCLLVDRDAFDLVSDVSRPEYFSTHAHQILADAVLRMYLRGEHVDVVTVSGRLTSRGLMPDPVAPDLPFSLAKAIGTVAGARHYAERVRSLWTLREAQRAARALLDTPSDPEAAIRDVVRRLSLLETGRASTIRKAGDIARELLTDLIAEAKGQKPPRHVYECGLRPIDRRLGGFEPGTLVTLSARPGVGKSVLATRLARGFSSAGHGTAVFWLEDGEWAFGRRHLAEQLRLQAYLLRRGYPSAIREYEDALRKLDDIGQWPLHVVTPKNLMSVEEMCGIIRRLKREQNIRVVIADHLGELKLDLKTFDGRPQALGHAVRMFRQVCRECEVVPILMVQMNRDVEKDEDGRGRSKLSYLFGSGEIEQIARVVGFISRKDPTDEELLAQGDGPVPVTIDFKKVTNGAPGKVELAFYPECMALEEMPPRPVPDNETARARDISYEKLT